MTIVAFKIVIQVVVEQGKVVGLIEISKGK